MRFRVTSLAAKFDWETPALPVLVGRGDDCALRFDGESAKFVSWEHLEIGRADDGSIYVIDLSSSNGTFVNGIRIFNRTPVVVGSIIQFGRSGPQLVATELRDPISTPPASLESSQLVGSAAATPRLKKARARDFWSFLILVLGWIVGGLLGIGLGLYLLGKLPGTGNASPVASEEVPAN